uniref:receptor-type tyrosine-protein phosphatase V isoform X1 n=1 Tax=Callithrix jacchus TaxID=9483 RepID=UPI0008403F9D|nr:receptor-type tyrosine-protein phosphatase V isoform X1 [Callithrix jacchus]XP_054104037.1 receptor-type tyrosine-protein phosphatase V isoform X1 [Callithrix jacchus]XP_054104038.1 receptor-type tyrosine-protein phosphatase V isoform X1 [Callithrix jacchus]
MSHFSPMTESSQEAINHMCHDHYYGGHDSYLAILLPNPFYLGPWAVPRSWTVPVRTEDCGHTKETCNGQLKLGSKYRFIVTALTSCSPPETIISFSAFSEPRASVSVGTEDCGHTKETCNGQLKLGSKHSKGWALEELVGRAHCPTPRVELRICVSNRPPDRPPLSSGRPTSPSLSTASGRAIRPRALTHTRLSFWNSRS